METKKNPGYDINRQRNGLLQLGAVTVLALCLSAFEYQSFSYETATISGDHVIMTEEPPVYLPEPPKPEPLKPPQKRTNNIAPSNAPAARPATDFTLTGNDQQLITGSLNFDGVIFNVPSGNDEPVIDDDDVTIVEEMPYYKEFEKIKNKDDRKSATDAKMISLVLNDIKYPSMAREVGIQGTVYVSFRVNKKGNVEDIKVIQSVHPELDQEAVRVVKLLPEMEPGRQRGKAVNVRYTIPVRFQIK